MIKSLANIIKPIRHIVVVGLVVVTSVFMFTAAASAQTPPASPSPSVDDSYKSLDKDVSATGDADIQNSTFFKDYLIPAINILSAGVVALAAIFMVVSGIQYSSGRDNPQTVQAAKSHIVNIIIGLIAYMFVYGFLQFIIPGGLI